VCVTVASAQGAAFDDGACAVAVADGVGRAFCAGAFGGVRIKQVPGEVGTLSGGQFRDAAANEPEGAFVIQLIKERAGVAVDAVGQLGGVRERDAAREGFEVRAFQFQGDDTACDVAGFGAVGDLF
jgi:hypothetical protein